MKDLKNTAIKTTGHKHSEKIIAWYKSNGVDSGCNGNADYGYYYCSPDTNRLRWLQSLPGGAKLIELSKKKTFPRDMMVRDDDDRWKKMKVVGKLSKSFKYRWITADGNQTDYDSFTGYQYAKEVIQKEEKIEKKIKKLQNKLEKIRAK